MNDKHTISQLEAIESKLKVLLESYEQKVDQVKTLQDENARLERVIAAQNDDLKNFQNRDKISKIVSTVTVGEQGRNTELKLKINEYLKEIDKCIAHLKG